MNDCMAWETCPCCKTETMFVLVELHQIVFACTTPGCVGTLMEIRGDIVEYAHELQRTT